MKNFDTARNQRKRTKDERTFIIGGEEFVARDGVHPDVLAQYDEINQDTTAIRTLEIIDNIIISFLEGDHSSEERYRAVRGKREDPITVEDLEDLVKWLMETQTSRPTGRPGDSSPGPDGITTTSTGISDLREAAAA